MARGRLMLRLTPNTWLLPMLDIPTLVMVLAILVIPILLAMDTETLVMLDLAMLVLLVLDSAMDIPMLPLSEDAETISELLCHAKFEHFLTNTILCLLPFVFNKKSITLEYCLMSN